MSRNRRCLTVIYKRYIYKKGKKFGPYYYENWKENGKVITKYIGPTLPEKYRLKKHRDKDIIKGFPNKYLILGGVLLLLAVTFFNFVILVQLAPTGKISVNIDKSFDQGDFLSGIVKLSMKQGELIPADTKVLIDNSGESKEFLLNELLSEQPIEGTFYMRNKDISGNGLGFGVAGEKIIYPEINFIMKIKNINKEDALQKQEDLSIVGNVIHEPSKEVQGVVSAEKPFIYELSSGETAEIISSSKPIILSIESGIATITTDYSETEKGFGEDYLNDKEIDFSFDLEKTGLTAKQGNLKISFIYDNKEIISTSIETKITSKEPEQITQKIIKAEKETKKGKQVRLSVPKGLENTPISVNIPKRWKVRQEYTISVYWKEQDEFIEFDGIDSDDDEIIDTIDWIVSASGTQTFEIIIITKAEHLDSNRSFISDIYDEVYQLDDIWSETINNREYIRVMFEQNLTSENDITIYPRIVSGNPKIEVYEKDENELIAEFSDIKSNEYNKVLLTKLQESQDTFDLKILGGNVEFDYVVDPYINVTDTNWITQTGTTYRTVHSLSWTAETNSRYLIMIFGEARLGSTNAEARVSIQGDGIEQFYIADRPAVANTEIMPFSVMQVYDGTGASVDYNIRISSSSASATIGVRNLRIIALRIDNLPNAHYNYTYSTLEQTNVNNVWGDAAGDTDEIKFAPTTPGYYMIWAGASISSGSTSSSASWRVNIDNGAEYIPYLEGGESTWSYARIEDRATTERVNFNAIAARYFTAEPHSIKMQIADIDTTSSTRWRDRSVIIMRLSDVFTNWWSTNSVTQSSTTSTIFQNKSMLQQPSINGNYVVIGSQSIRGSSASYDFEQQLAIDGISYGLRAWRPKDILDYPSESFITNFSVNSDSHWSAMQYRRQDASGTEYAKNSEILVLGLEEVANSPPTISYIQPIPDQTPLEGTIKQIVFEVKVSDTNGVDDIDDSNITSQFNKTGETTRNTTCTWNRDIDQFTANYSCSVGMQYYDAAGTWNITIQAKDLSGEQTINNSNTFVYQELKGIIIKQPTTLTWSTLNPGLTNQSSDNDPSVIENTGNYEGPILITAYDLIGEANPSYSIPALNFRAGSVSGSECTSTQLQNSTPVTISGSMSKRGIGAQEEIYYCLTSVPYVSSQSYSATGANSWIISV